MARPSKRKVVETAPELSLVNSFQEPVLTRPTLKELETIEYVEVRSLKPTKSPQLIAGLAVSNEPKVFPVSYVRSCGKSHLQALASDPSIEVRIVK